MIFQIQHDQIADPALDERSQNGVYSHRYENHIESDASDVCSISAGVGFLWSLILSATARRENFVQKLSQRHRGPHETFLENAKVKKPALDGVFFVDRLGLDPPSKISHSLPEMDSVPLLGRFTLSLGGPGVRFIIGAAAEEIQSCQLAGGLAAGAFAAATYQVRSCTLFRGFRVSRRRQRCCSSRSGHGRSLLPGRRRRAGRKTLDTVFFGRP